MENRTRNIILSILFWVFILFLIIGGYVYIKDLSNNNKNDKNKQSEKNIDFRIDKEKEYIYFENEEIVSTEPEITFSDVILNIEGAEILNSSLKTEMDKIRESIIKLDESNKDTKKTLLYEDSDIYSAIERNYEIYKTKDYYSVIISDLDFNCYNDFIIKNIKGYVIDIKNGKILTNEDLMKKYNLSFDTIKDKVSLELDEKQNITENGIEVINKEETLNTLFDNYAIYIDGSGLFISYIVKSNIVNYNDNVKLN